MLYKGVLITAASGRIDVAVASHNRGGPYFRALGNPNPNPATAEQVVIRTAMADVVAAWKALTTDQRLAWEQFSIDNPRASRIGVVRPAGGLPEYTRANICRRQCDITLGSGLGIIDTPPEDGSTPVVSVGLGLVATGGTPKLTYTVDPSLDWFTEDGAALLIYAGPALPPSVNYYRSPMTLVMAVLGGHSPDTDTALCDGSTAAGDHRSVRLRLLRADGSVSEHWYVMLTAP